jgi:hypothetical protein
MDSKSFELNKKDIAEILKVMLAAGASAALVAGMQALNAIDLGTFGPIVTAALTSLIKFIQQWAGDHSQPS